MKTRLNCNNRNVILNRAIEHAFGKREENLKKIEQAFAEDIYNDTYSPDTQAKMKALPASFFKKVSHILCRFSSDDDNVEFSEKKIIAYKHYDSVAKVYEDSHPLSIRYFEIKKIKKQFQQERSDAIYTTRSLLESVNTIGQLLDTWPEAEIFVSDLINKTPYLPTHPIAKLNEMLGLTPIQQPEQAIQGEQEAV